MKACHMIALKSSSNSKHTKYKMDKKIFKGTATKHSFLALFCTCSSTFPKVFVVVVVVCLLLERVIIFVHICLLLYFLFSKKGMF